MNAQGKNLSYGDFFCISSPSSFLWLLQRLLRWSRLCSPSSTPHRWNLYYVWGHLHCKYFFLKASLLFSPFPFSYFRFCFIHCFFLLFGTIFCFIHLFLILITFLFSLPVSVSPILILFVPSSLSLFSFPLFFSAYSSLFYILYHFLLSSFHFISSYNFHVHLLLHFPSSCCALMNQSLIRKFFCLLDKWPASKLRGARTAPIVSQRA